MSQYRKRLRRQGLRARQVVVYDIRDSKVVAEARRQAARIQASPDETEVLDWIEASVDTTGWS
jgi:hypothetical protein